MKLFFLFFFKYLFSPRAGALVRFVSAICILGLMVSLSSLIVVICVMSGFGISIRDRLLKHEPHLVIMKDSHEKLSLERVHKILNSVDLKDNIQMVRSFETQDVILKSENRNFIGAVGRGYSDKDFQSMAANFENNYFNEVNQNIEWDFDLSSDTENQNFVFMSDDIAHRLSVFAGNLVFILPAESLLLPVTELPPPSSARVRAVIDSSHPSYNAKLIYYKMGSIPLLKDTASLSQGIEIFLKQPDQFSFYKAALEAENFKVESWSDRNSSLFFSLKLEKALMAVFLFLAALISSFSITSMMRLLLAQKRKDIGILLVMGWPIKKVRRLFLGISFMMASIGLIGGVILAFLICLFLKYNSIPFLPGYYNKQIPVDIDGYVFLYATLAALLLAYIASWVPIYSYTLSSSVDLIRRRQV